MNTKSEIGKLLEKIYLFTNDYGVRLFLVGGCLRDFLLGRETKDFDFVLDAGGEGLVRKLCQRLGGTFVLLDADNKVYRVVISLLQRPHHREMFNFDFSQMRGKKIEDDLAFRDFTVDAMALNMDTIFRAGKFPRRHSELVPLIIDPYSGKKDLKNRVIRKTSPSIFEDDPLRLLRAYRLAATLEFNIEKETELEIKKKSKLIERVSQERIRDEICRILSTSQAGEYLRALDKVGLLSRIIPEIELMKEKPDNYYHREGLWGHSIATIKAVDEILGTLPGIFPGMARRIKEHLSEIVFADADRKVLLKWTAMLHDIGKPRTVKREGKRVRFYGHEAVGAMVVRKIMERLKFSNKAIRIVVKMVENHMRPGNLSEAPVLTRRAIYRFFRDLSDEAVDTILLSMADRYSYRKKLLSPQAVPVTDSIPIRKHERTLRRMLREYYYKKTKILPERLLRGNEIMEKFSIPQGPLIGKLLKVVEEAQAEGKVKNREEAFQFLENILKGKGCGEWGFNI